MRVAGEGPTKSHFYSTTVEIILQDAACFSVQCTVLIPVRHCPQKKKKQKKPNTTKQLPPPAKHTDTTLTEEQGEKMSTLRRTFEL